VGDAAAAAWCAGLRVRIETKLVAGDVEAHVKRLVEIRRVLKRLRVPGPGPRQIADVIDHRSESLDHVATSRGEVARISGIFVHTSPCARVNAYVRELGEARRR